MCGAWPIDAPRHPLPPLRHRGGPAARPPGGRPLGCRNAPGCGLGGGSASVFRNDGWVPMPPHRGGLRTSACDSPAAGVPAFAAWVERRVHPLPLVPPGAQPGFTCPPWGSCPPCPSDASRGLRGTLAGRRTAGRGDISTGEAGPCGTGASTRRVSSVRCVTGSTYAVPGGGVSSIG
jgi:hypothetical protein